MFSFGIVLWELLTGEEPYADLHYGVIIGNSSILAFLRLKDSREIVCPHKTSLYISCFK